MKKLTILITALALALIAAACGDGTAEVSTSNGESPTDSATADETDETGIVGSDDAAGADADVSSSGDPDAEDEPAVMDGWVLTSGTADGDALVLDDDANITIDIADGAATGRAACNSYQADITIDGSSVTVGPIVHTEMACDKGSLMDLEAKFLDALSRVDEMDETPTTLTLTGDAVELIFAR